jgi:hypothetical protein
MFIACLVVNAEVKSKGPFAMI